MRFLKGIMVLAVPGEGYRRKVVAQYSLHPLNIPYFFTSSLRAALSVNNKKKVYYYGMKTLIFRDLLKDTKDIHI